MNEIERIIRRISPVELAAWIAMDGWLPKGQLAARFEAEAIRLDILAESRPGAPAQLAPEAERDREAA